MGFKQKYGVFRHIVGQPLLCEQSFSAVEDAEAHARGFDGSVVLAFDEFRPSYEERQASREDTFSRREDAAPVDEVVDVSVVEKKPRGARRA